MHMRDHAFQRLGAALFLLVVAAACSEQVPTRPEARSFKPSLSREFTPTPGRHVFVVNGNLPKDFANRVAAHGGSVVSSMPGIGVAITQGLSDADASIVAGNAAVTRD